MATFRIKEICKEKGVTLAQLASGLGIKRNSLSQALSRGNISSRRLGEIASLLGVEIPDLFRSAGFVAVVRYGGRFYHSDTLAGLKAIVAEMEKA